MKLHSRRKKKYFSPQSKIQRLKQELAGKQQELVVLEQQHGLLHSKHKIMSEISSTMEFLHAHAEQHNVWGSDSPVSPGEVELLQQLAAALRPSTGIVQSAADRPSDRVIQHSSTSSGALYLEEPMFSDGDPLYAFRCIHIMPPFPGAADMTLETYLAEYATILRDMALNLEQHRAQQRWAAVSGGTPSQENQLFNITGVDEVPPIERVRAGLVRYFNMMMTVAAIGRCDLTHAAVVTSCDNPAMQLPEPPYHRYLQVVPLLGLTERQRRLMLEAAKVFTALLASIQQEMQHTTGSCGSSREGAGASSSSSSSSYDNLAAGLRAFGAFSAQDTAYRNQRIKQEQATARMQRTLLKDMFLRRMWYGYIWGHMTVMQVAELHCLMHPFSPSCGIFVKAVAAYHAQQEGKKGLPLSQRPGA